MIFKLLLVFITALHVSAYELPKIQSVKSDNPEIILFDALSTKVNDKLSYTIRWDTINATDVNITYFGKVQKSGEITVTEDEYNRGPITLNALNAKSSKSVTKTINNQRGGNSVSTFIKKESVEDDYYYPSTMPYRRRPYLRPRLRRGY
jgi:hypothetical protein